MWRQVEKCSQWCCGFCSPQMSSPSIQSKLKVKLYSNGWDEKENNTEYLAYSLQSASLVEFVHWFVSFQGLFLWLANPTEVHKFWNNPVIHTYISENEHVTHRSGGVGFGLARLAFVVGRNLSERDNRQWWLLEILYTWDHSDPYVM